MTGRRPTRPAASDATSTADLALRGMAAHRQGGTDEDGVASVWTVLSASGVFLLLLGLVFDGGSAVDARAEAKRAAEQAARAGADELQGVRSHQESVDTHAAQARARQVLAQAGWTGTVTVNGLDVTVTITDTSDNVFLGAVGLPSFPVDVTGSATSITGPQEPTN
jgi:Flp pilus assembly protein TadG